VEQISATNRSRNGCFSFACARADILSVAFAGAGQTQDAGGKVIHVAPDTTSTITSKSISKDGGHATYRGLLKVARGAVHTKSFVRCDGVNRVS
jgi:Fe-S cluster assembly protein SufB